VEKPGEWGPEKVVMRGSGLVRPLDESGAGESRVGRTLHILVRPAVDSATARD
jgi:hypothetical protein